MLPDIEIIVGTYTDFLLGYQLVQNDDKVQLKATFADKSHAGSLKCVAVQGPWVASGGSDDRIFIYDMRTRKQSHILHSHTGTVNAVVFSPDLTHLLSASADGHMMATRVGNWTIEGDWRKAHAGSPVTHIACHPSSRLALSLGGDQILNTWNLVKGRVAYRTNLKSKRTLGSTPDCLSWSTDGKHFTLSGPLAIEIWNIETASVVRHTKTPSKPICVVWLSEVDCLVGLENGSIAWISLEADANDDTPPTLIVAHETRVKGIAYLNEALATISSAGEIKIWTCNIDEKELKQIASGNIDCRPTCLGLLDTKQFGKPAQTQLSADTVQKQVQKPQPQQQASSQDDAEIELLKPRTFVSIEYEADAKDTAENASDDDDESESSNDSDNAKKVPKKSKLRPKSKADAAPDSSSSEDDSDSDDSEIESQSDSESDSDSERRSKPKKKANKRKANVNNKSRAKQTKKQ